MAWAQGPAEVVLASWWGVPSQFGEAAAPAGQMPGQWVWTGWAAEAGPTPAGYVDMELIPAGAREIHIEEVASSTNFLALRGEDPGKYFLNGNWTIQWDGDYEAAGTVFTYSRSGDLESLTSPGPTLEPVWSQVPSPVPRAGRKEHN